MNAIMPERANNSGGHWDLLAEELGLPPDESGAAPQAREEPKPAPVRQQPERRVREVPPVPPPSAADEDHGFGEGILEAQVDEEAIEEEAPPERPRRRRDNNVSVEQELREVLDHVEGGLPARQQEPSEGERGGRRGRRRGGKSRPAAEHAPPREEPEIREEPETAEPEPESSETPVTSSDDESQKSPRRRGRRRGPRKKDRDESASEVEAPSAPESAADEDTADFSNWTLPSWQEVIAGLYRPPER